MELKSEDGMAGTAKSEIVSNETDESLALKGWRGLGYQSEGEESDGKRWEEEEIVDEQTEGQQDEESDESNKYSKIANKDNEVVILVVSNEQSHKQGIVQVLTKREPESWKEDIALAGTRVLTRENPRRKIVDVTPLVYVSGKSPTAIARRWISNNSLRRLIAKRFVVGVCVITISVLEAPCTSSVFGYDNCWVDVLRIIFRDQKHGIMFILKHDKDVDDSTKRKITRFIRNHDFNATNIIFSGSDNDVVTVLEDSVGLKSNARLAKRNGFLLFLERLFSFVRGKGRQRLGGARTDPGLGVGWRNRYIRLSSPLFVVTPFFMDEASSSRKKVPAWSSERIILFGRSGSGKSTLAQMLTLGKLDPDSTAFKSSSGIRGMTKTIEQGEGRGWYIVDTPGFGESQDKDSTISSEDVQSKVKKFVDLAEGTFAHYLFVVKKDRVDQLEVNLWKFFLLLFGADMSAHFSIIFSNASQEWLDENLIHLQNSFEGCKSFLCAEFPTMHDFDIEGLSQDFHLHRLLQEENRSIQKESLARLEQELAKLDRCDRACRYGKNSRVSKMLERSRANSDMKIERSLRTKMIYQGSEALFRVDEVVSALVRHLTINDRIALVPLVL